MRNSSAIIALLLTVLFFASCKNDSEPRRLELLFLGHASTHHNSGEYAPILYQYLAQKGINITYSEDPESLNKENLALFDGLILYANHDSISSSQEKALLEYVRSGKGFIPLHSASYCFRNSDEFVSLVGAQFKTHGWETFSIPIDTSKHDILKGLKAFETTDETYVHHLIGDDLTLLMERDEKGRMEPWTWVRNEGKGRVFYTAYGHDERTWTNDGFLQLVYNGILWAVGDDAKKRTLAYRVAPLTYSDAKIPNYEQRDPPPKLQAPLDAEASMSHIQVPPGFSLELFASEPMIVNPIHMDWDYRGRLWVIETVDYPNVVRDEDGVGDDKIKILEDTNNDGKADKVTVFADNLNIPTSFVFVNGGILVSQAPHFLFLKDSDGDDVADIRETVITGWGVSDTHAGPSNLRYGFDNKIWGTVGYSGYEGSLEGAKFSFDQAVFNLSTDYKDLTVHTMTTNNTWGLGFTENNDIFVSTANNTHTAFVNVPQDKMRRVKGFGRDVASKLDGHYFMHPATKNFRQVDVFGGFTAAAGHSFYTARNYPKEYWNRIAFVAEPTGHLLHRAVFEPFGSGFMETDGWNIMASSDEWVSPIQADVGPDGNVWVLDWYNFIVQHNPTPEGFDNGKGNAHINPLRDKEHGRIYRIVYQGKKANSLKLDPENSESLLAALKSDNLFWRLTAQRLIVENQLTELRPELEKLINSTPEDEIGLNPAAMHAIWTLQGLGFDDSSLEAVQQALNHKNAGVRKAAIQALPHSEETAQKLLSSGVFQDENLNTRLATLLKAGELEPGLEIGKTLYELSRFPEVAQDLWLSKAIQAAALVHRNGFIEAFETNTNPVAEDGLTSRIYANYNTSILPMTGGEYYANATEMKGKEVYINGRIWVPRPDELNRQMLFSHGDNRNGYGLYRDKNDWWIYINQNGKTYSAKTQYEPTNWFGFEFTFTKNGMATFKINREPVIVAKSPGLFQEDFTQGFRLGTDPEGIVPVTSAIRYAPFNQTFVNVVAEFVQPDNSSPTIVADFDFTLRTVPLKMEFNRDTLEVEAGKMVSIAFENPDFMQHNLLILQPGSLGKVGSAADKMVSEKDAAERNYVPDLPEVLYSTRLVNPNDKVRLTFKAPTEPGVYPFVCTFPGHWRTMNGVLIVK